MLYVGIPLCRCRHGACEQSGQPASSQAVGRGRSKIRVLEALFLLPEDSPCRGAESVGLSAKDKKYLCLLALVVMSSTHSLTLRTQYVLCVCVPTQSFPASASSISPVSATTAECTVFGSYLGT